MSTPDTTTAVGTTDKGHAWTFFRAGDVDQVILRDGADIENLYRLDQKLWMALAMPTFGVEIDPRTTALLDTDKDGRIRPPEVLAAIAWMRNALRDTSALLRGGEAVPLASIRDEDLLVGARRILANLGRADAEAITLADVSSQERIFSGTKFNGDGVIPAEAADDDATRASIADIIARLGPVPDRSGKPGVNLAHLDAFFAQAAAFTAWADRPGAEPALFPLLPEATQAAHAAVQAIRAKVDDYFARCRLAAFDPRARAAMNRQESEYLALATQELTTAAQELTGFPIAWVEAGRPLPLCEGINPAWATALRTLTSQAIEPLLGSGKTELTETDWTAVQAALAPYAAWRAAKPDTVVESLGAEHLRALLNGATRQTIAALIAQDAALAPENARIESVGKLVLFQRDLHEVLTNMVNFADFYGGTRSVFQAGTLYLDARACELCIDVTDPAKHAALAGLSNAFLAYCDIVRPGGLKKSIAAVFTNGDADSMMVGRNGVFYDRKGQDWDATITRIVSNPISVREAFWLPYKKFIRFIEEQIAKRAQAAEATSLDRMATTAERVATADTAKPAPAAPKKLDLGTIALIGTAVGGISALVGGMLQALFGLGFWLPLGLLGLVLLISGPSMILAWMKLRMRNLGPILDANGWAINTRARLNVPFGATLTKLAQLPPGSTRTGSDPFAEKRRSWRTWVVVAVLFALAYCWWLGKLDAYLPESARRLPPVEAAAP